MNHPTAINIKEHPGSLMESVDARSKLAGSNRMEILLFSLGTHEVFGINVFKVRGSAKRQRLPRHLICRRALKG